ncbi:MAG: peptidoglycan bridge formation glycyltransferase FemA/FemB family protein [Spirochaetaceae bacterium]|nr:peptidoglycan bridge formation glycyltransferase FemA/FemB family protein [Spirochaetaceae bacterium]
MARIKNMPFVRLVPADLSVCSVAGSFLQSSFWGTFKESFGWKAFAFSAEWRTGAAPLLVLHRVLARGFALAYVPWGPEIPSVLELSDAERSAALPLLAAALQPLLPRDAVFIRFDPPWRGGEGSRPFPEPFVRAAADIQAPDTALVDLCAGEEAILSRMKSKCRYNVRLGGRKVAVRQADEAGLDDFYRLLRETARRDGIALHEEAYYRRLFACARASGETLRLYLAYGEGQPVAGVVVLFRGQVATYLYGASSGRHRGLMAPHALQWQAMRDAKAAGAVAYDLFGIPPDADPAHPMAGLHRFKTGFGGVVVHRAGSWDYPVKPILYALFRRVERLRKRARDVKKRALQAGRARNPAD